MMKLNKSEAVTKIPNQIVGIWTFTRVMIYQSIHPQRQSNDRKFVEIIIL